MKPEAFGLQAAGAGGDLPEEWQALIASQASTLAALVLRMQTAAATMRQRQAPAAQWQEHFRRGTSGDWSFPPASCTTCSSGVLTAPGSGPL